MPPEDSTSLPAIFFLSGSHFSGAEEWERTLNASPGILMVPLSATLEDIFLLGPDEPILSILARWHAGVARAYPGLEGFPGQTRTFERVSDALIADLEFIRARLKPGARAIGFQKGFFLKKGYLVRRFFPGAAFITLLRDGKYVVPALQKLLPEKYNQKKAVEAWRTSARQISFLREKYPENTLHISAEAAVADPTETLKKILLFLGGDQEHPAQSTLPPRTIEPVGVPAKEGGGVSRLAAAELFNFGYSSVPPAEVVLVSYPKTGRTWVRLMLGRVLSSYFGLKASLLDLEEMALENPAVPLIHLSHDEKAHNRRAEELSPGRSFYARSKVAFLHRDPRDVIVSYYFELTRRNRKFRSKRGTYEGSLSQFLRHDTGSIDTLLRFLNIWASNRRVPAEFLLLRYEDFHADAFAQLRRLVDFCGLKEIPDEIIAESVAFASFENMRRMEAKNQLGSERLQAPDLEDPESFKTRKGEIGGYRQYLDQDDIDYFNQKLAGLDPFFLRPYL